jgi:hypothetical protein
LGFAAWKKPLVDFLAREVDAGSLPNSKRALDMFWRPCLDVDSQRYVFSMNIITKLSQLQTEDAGRT